MVTYSGRRRKLSFKVYTAFPLFRNFGGYIEADKEQLPASIEKPTVLTVTSFCHSGRSSVDERAMREPLLGKECARIFHFLRLRKVRMERWSERAPILLLSGVMLCIAALGSFATDLVVGEHEITDMRPLGVITGADGDGISSVRLKFGICGMSIANNCVIDGDTIEYEGARIRMIDYDTPEITAPKCPSEYALGLRAKLRLLELLNSGAVEVRVLGSRDVDKYRRKLRLVLVKGHSVGDTLISEGLAWPWEGHRHDWCS